MESFMQYIQQASGAQWLVLGIVMVFIWFLPALLALFFNRKHVKLIALACVPAGLSVIAWSGVLLWATTGKVVDKYQSKSTAVND